MTMLKCADCNSRISDKADMCPHCGCPIEESIKNKKMNTRKKVLLTVISIIVILTVIVLIVGKVNIIKRQEEKKGFYNGLAWGTSKEELQERIGEDCIDNSSKDCLLNAVSDYEGIKNVEAAEIYYYKDGFNKVSILVSFDEEDCSLNTVSDKLVKIYDGKYGTHEEISSYGYTWTTSESMIELVCISSELISIKYENINTVDKE